MSAFSLCIKTLLHSTFDARERWLSAGKGAILIVALSVGTILLHATHAVAQDVASKPLRFVTAEPGGGNDFAARVIAQGLAASGRQTVVENRGGASGEIAAQIVAKATPDGNTLLLYSTAFWTVPLLRRVSYDPLKDFAPVTMAVVSPNVLVLHPAVAANSVKELIALAKARPGELNYATGATASTGHLAAELFKSMAGIEIVRVGYKGNGPALNDLAGGHVQLTFGTAPSVAPFVKSGRLRALAVTTARPSAILPDVPPIAASLPGYELATIYCIFAPAVTPTARIAARHQELLRALFSPEAKERFAAFGAEPLGSTSHEMAFTIKSEMTRLGKVIKDANIRAD